MGYNANLSAFPFLKPSSIDNMYDIPIAIPVQTSPSDGSTIKKGSLGEGGFNSENISQDILTSHDTLTSLASCNKLPIMSVIANGNDGNLPSNAIDNDLNTRWSNNGLGSYIQLDLGSKKSLCSVDIAWYRGDLRINNFVISVSDDGVIFTPKFTSTSSLDSSAQKYTLPTGTEGKYVRITVNGNNENEWASISEISVLGDASAGGNGGGDGSDVVGSLVHKRQISPGSGTWSSYESLGSGIRPNSDLALAMNSDGRLQAFVIGTNNQLYYKSQTGAGSSTWSSGWTSLGGGIKADTSPAVARNSDGRLQVFVVGTNNQLYYKTQSSPNSNTWSPAWTSLGGGLRANTESNRNSK